MRLMKSILIIGIVLSLISFLPDLVIEDVPSVDEETYNVYVVQFTNSPYLRVRVRYDQNVSLYVLTLEEGHRFIGGEPFEDITKVFAAENITEYSDIVPIDTPGMYVILITNHFPIEYVHCDFHFYRSVPNLWVLGSGLLFVTLGSLMYLRKYQISNKRRNV
ncbi:MAG: hypothetical protein RTU30_03495 [Candidatus Thorarchaeota archaeon]